MHAESPEPSQNSGLKRSQDLFEMLLQAIPSSLLVIDRDLRVVSANKNFLAKNRKGESEVIGKRLGELLPQAIVEHVDISGQVREVLQTQQPMKGKRMTYRAPGIPIRVYYYSILPFSRDGRVENVILLMEDVTEQDRLSKEVRRVERHLASVVESARDIVLSTDSEGRILTWNSSAEMLSGFSLEDVRGEPFRDRCAPEQFDQIRNLFNRSRNEENAKIGEFDLITKSGKRIPISWIFSPMKDDATKEIGMVAIGRDLTEPRKLELQLLQSQKLAALGVMAGGIAHEIRNPLAICSSAAQFLLEEEGLSEFGKECVQKNLTHLHRAAAIIENLLRFARPSGTSDMRQLDLVTIVTDALDLVANQAMIQKISVEFVCPHKSIVVFGNPDLLRQVFFNLFLNSINAMPDGGNLSVHVDRTETEVISRIVDTGRGIPEETLPNVFDPFYTMSPVGEGTGLGLSICYSIVKQHFGSIEAESIAGKQTVFAVRLPALG